MLERTMLAGALIVFLPLSALPEEVDPGMSPTAVTVFAREDIDTSGASTLPDLLRMVPGMDVAVASPFYGSVSEAKATSRSKPQAAHPPQCRGFLRSGEIRLTHVWGSYAFAHARPIVVAALAFGPGGRSFIAGTARGMVLRFELTGEAR